MAVTWKVEGSRTSEYRFYPEDITVKPELNGRHDLPDISYLIADMLSIPSGQKLPKGQTTPVIVRNDGGKPVLVAGYSRWRAVSEINKRKLTPVKMQLRCCYQQLSEVESVIVNISENRFRNSTTEIDDAHNIALLGRLGMTEEQIATVYFPAAKEKTETAKAIHWVKQRQVLISLTPEAAKALEQGRMKPTAAVAIAKLSAEQQRKAVKGDGKITSASAKEASGVTAKPGMKEVRTGINLIIETGKLPSGFKVADEVVEYLECLLEGRSVEISNVA